MTSGIAKPGRQNIHMAQKTKVVLVEDDYEIATWIKKKIGQIGGIELSGWNNKHEGTYDLVCKTAPDIVILDLSLPDGSGIDILKKIKKDLQDIKVIVLTINPHVKNSCLRLGADYFFNKGSDIYAFIEKLKEVSCKQ